MKQEKENCLLLLLLSIIANKLLILQIHLPVNYPSEAPPEYQLK